MALTKVPNELSSTPSIVDGGNGTAITIDSSENTGFGGSTYEGSVTSNASSVWISSTGYLSANVNNDWGLGVNRTGTDGTLINLRRNGADVGSIGTDASGNLQTLSATGNYRFGDSNTTRWSVDATRMYPLADATYDIGLSSVRVRDIYLSGGVNFSANANASGMTSETLDYYEEGSWTPILRGDVAPVSGQSYGATTAHYVKVGQLVYLGFDFRLTAAGSTSGSYAVIGSLPFPALNSNLGGGSLGYYTNLSNITGPVVFYVAASQAYLMSGGSTYVARTALANDTRLIGFLSYRTSS